MYFYTDRVELCKTIICDNKIITAFENLNKKASNSKLSARIDVIKIMFSPNRRDSNLLFFSTQVNRLKIMKYTYFVNSFMFASHTSDMHISLKKKFFSRY